MSALRVVSSVKCSVVAAVIAMSAACSTPLSLRGARVMEPGELEMILSPQLLLDVDAIAAGDAATRPAVQFTPELSARFGLVDRIDMQLRIDKTILPEVSVGWQLIGDPTRDDDFALTATGGLKLTALSMSGVIASAPLQLLIEAPITEVVAVTAGLRAVPYVGASSGRQVATVVGVSPGVVGGVRFTIGRFVVSPEAGFAGSVAVGQVAVDFVGRKPVVRPPLVASIGFNIGGQIDFDDDDDDDNDDDDVQRAP